MHRLSRPVAVQPPLASELRLPIEPALAADQPPALRLAARARSQSEPRLGGLSSLASRQDAKCAPIHPAPPGTASVAKGAFETALSVWERAAPEPGLPNERKSRREAAHRMRCVREDAADSLDFDDLYLSSLPACLGKLHSVQHLNVGCNNLATLPDLPPALTHLYAHGNRLTHLPELPLTLKILDVHQNRLTQLPALPPALTRLTAVVNPLTELPPLPAGLQMLSADRRVIDAAIRANDEKIAASAAELIRLMQRQPTAPEGAEGTPAPQALQAPEHATAAFAPLSVELIAAIAACLPKGARSAASMSASGRCLHAVVQPGLDIARNIDRLKTAQAQIAILKRLSASTARID